MSDVAERAEKAARAKALLKKRQQQKASGNVGDGRSISRTGSPAPSTPPPNFPNSPSNIPISTDIKDTSMLFGNSASTGDIDFVEFGVLAAPSPLRPMPSPTALGRATSSPLPHRPHHNQPHSPRSPVLTRLERRTPMSAPYAETGPSSNDEELQAVRAKYEAEIARLNIDLQTACSTAAKETETLRSEVQHALSQAKEARQSSELKAKELENLLSQTQAELEELRGLSSNQQQTITLLANEKTALMDHVAELDPLRNRLSELEEDLIRARSEIVGLQEKLNMLEMEKNNVTFEVKDLKSKLQTSDWRAQSLQEQLRASEVDVEDTQRNLMNTRHKLEQCENELRILKEDDRVEVLEQALSASRERVEELGEGMNRLHESLTTATRNEDNLRAQLSTMAEEKNEHLERCTKLDIGLATANKELEQLRQQHQVVSEERARLQTESDTSRNTITAVQQQMQTLSADLAIRTRNHDELELTLSTTSRKLAETEVSLQSLRSDNLDLLAQLEETRPKLIQLTNKVVEDEERISFGDRKIHGLEKEVFALETDLHDLRLQLQNAETRVRQGQESVIKAQAEKAEIEHEIIQMKKSHDELDSIFAQLRDDMGKIKDERQKAEKRSTQLMEERDMLRSEINSLKVELDHAHYASEELQRSEADSNEVLEGMRTELESLREQLFEKEQEVSSLRSSAAGAAAVPRDRPGHGSSPSLDDELFGSLRDQHALDMSNAYSRIRELESEVFTAKANEHALQKRVAALEDELGQMLRQSRIVESSGQGRRSMSMIGTRPHTPSSIPQSSAYHRHHHRTIRPRPVYEENLSTEVRHRRKISLGMLKARIESERAAGILSMTGIGLGMSTGSPLSRVSSIIEIDETTPEMLPVQNNGVKQSNYSTSRQGSQGADSAPSPFKFTSRYHLKGWDESHIFWCHACKGDLVVL